MKEKKTADKKLTKLPMNKPASEQNCKLIKQQVDKMASEETAN